MRLSLLLILATIFLFSFKSWKKEKAYSPFSSELKTIFAFELCELHRVLYELRDKPVNLSLRLNLLPLQPNPSEIVQLQHHGLYVHLRWVWRLE